MPDHPWTIFDKEVQFEELPPPEIIEKINGINSSDYNSHILNLCNRFEYALSAEIQSIPVLQRKKTFLTEVSNNLEEAFTFIHQKKKEREILLQHSFPPRIFFTHECITVYVKYPNGKLYHILHPSEVVVFSKYIKNQYVLAKRALMHIQSLLDSIEKDEAKYLAEASYGNDADDLRIVTKLNETEVSLFFKQLTQINSSTNNNKHLHKPIMKEEDIEQLLQANFRVFKETSKIKKFSPNCSQADLLYFVYRFYYKNGRRDKKTYAVFLINNFTQFNRYNAKNSKDVADVYRNMRNSPPSKHPIQYVI
ncbi:MAG: hypothetical protein ACW99Q_14225 [Candidatus Kariarchaeaceae archaeon]